MRISYTSSQKALVLLFVTGVSLFFGCNVVDDLTGKDNNDEQETLHPVLINGEWGYINQDGSIEISPQFEQALDFVNGFASVRANQSWGVVSESSKRVIIPPSFNVVGDFSENGLAPAQILGESYGFINTQGEFTIPAQYDLATNFSENRAAIRIDGQWGYVDDTGTLVIETQYSDARPFSEGLAAVETFDGWVYVDTEGEIAINPSFEITTAREFSEGFAAIQTTEGWGFIDQTGSPVITPDFDNAGSFSEGMAWLMEGDFIGYVTKEGTFSIEPQFAEAKAFSGDLAAVRLSSNWYYVNRKTSKLQFPNNFSEAGSFNNGIARVRVGNDDNARYGYIDTNGQYVWFPTR